MASELKEDAPPLFPSQRGLLCIIMFLASLFKTLLWNIIGMQIVCMTSAQGNMLESPFSWTGDVQKYILSANLLGFTVVMPFGGMTILKIGSKNTMAGGIFLAALMSLLSPLSAKLSPYALMSAEFIKGKIIPISLW